MFSERSFTKTLPFAISVNKLLICIASAAAVPGSAGRGLLSPVRQRGRMSLRASRASGPLRAVGAYLMMEGAAPTDPQPRRE